MKISRVSAEQADDAFAIVVRCREALESQGIPQWDAGYPSLSFFRAAAAEGTLFVLTDRAESAGVVVLNEWQLPEWSAVEWGEREGPVLVIHSLAVSPSAQGRGYGRALLNFCESFATDNGYAAIRLDAFPENPKALQLYVRHGYQLRGQVRVQGKPAGHDLYNCYEKRLEVAVKP